MEHHECKHEKEFITIRDDFEKIRDEDKKLVTWTVFWSIMLVLFGLLGTMMSNIYSQIDEHEKLVNSQVVELQKSSRETDLTQVKIETQLNQIQTQLSDISLKLSKVK